MLDIRIYKVYSMPILDTSMYLHTEFMVIYFYKKTHCNLRDYNYYIITIKIFLNYVDHASKKNVEHI